MKVSEVIEELKKLPQEMEVYIDCFHCGAAQQFKKLHVIALAETKKPTT